VPAAHLIKPKARINGREKSITADRKIKDRAWVDAPWRADAGSDISPIESFSTRVGLSVMPIVCAPTGIRSTAGYSRPFIIVFFLKNGDEHRRYILQEVF